MPRNEQTTFLPPPPQPTLERVERTYITSDSPVAASLGLRQSVETFGILQPLVLVQIPQDTRGYTYRVVDGRRRLDAATYADLVTVPALVFPEGTADTLAHAFSLSSHVHRAPNPVTDMRAIQTLQQGGRSLEDIAQRLHISVAQLRARLRLADLLPEFALAMDRGHITARTGRLLSRLPVEQQNTLLSRFEATGTVTVNDIREVTSVAQEAQLAILPDEVFTPPPPTPGNIALRDASPLRADHATRLWTLVGTTLDGAPIRVQFPMASLVMHPVQRPTVSIIGREVSVAVRHPVTGDSETFGFPDLVPAPPLPEALVVSQRAVQAITQAIEGSALAARRRHIITNALAELVGDAEDSAPVVLPPLPEVAPGEESWAAVLNAVSRAIASIPAHAGPDADAMDASLNALRATASRLLAGGRHATTV